MPHIKVENKYKAMLEYAENRMRMNLDPNREHYDIVSYSCIHFMKGVMEAAGVDAPWIFDPRPISYIEEIQDEHPVLEYAPSDNNLNIKKPDSLLGF